MSEYIKASDLDDTILRLNNDGWGITRNEHKLISNVLYEMPLYSFPNRKKGEWIVREDNTSFVKQLPRRWVECPCCGWSFSYDRIRDEFCSKCGADMRNKNNC